MQACQNMSVPLPVDAPGAKAYDRMQMNVFADIHKGSQMFTASKDLTTYGDLEHFRNAASDRMTFRKCLIDMSKIFLGIANGNDDSGRGIVTPRGFVTPRLERIGDTVSHVPNTSSIRRKTEDVSLVMRSTGLSPKRNQLKRLLEPATVKDREASKRFKSCPGCPVYRVSEDKGKYRGPGAQGSCIVCGRETNWYCVECRNWCCHDVSQPDGPEYFRDINTYSGLKGSHHHITGRLTCLMSCHPRFLRVESIGEENVEPSRI